MRSACRINTPSPGRHYQNNSDPPSSISLSCSIELPHANLFLNRMPYTYSRQGQSELTENHPIKNHYLISNIRKVMQNTMTHPSILRVEVIVLISHYQPHQVTRAPDSYNIGLLVRATVPPFGAMAYPPSQLTSGRDCRQSSRPSGDCDPFNQYCNSKYSQFNQWFPTKQFPFGKYICLFVLFVWSVSDFLCLSIIIIIGNQLSSI